MEIGFTKLSSKGQVVIPEELRKGLKQGEKIFAVRDENRIVLLPESYLSKKLRGDLEFARRTEEAWKSIDRGKGTKMDFDEFLRELKKWQS